jgi:hypothetical protein
MINVMQIIVQMPSFNLQFPSNAALFYSIIADISNFDIVPQNVKDEVFSFGGEVEETDVEDVKDTSIVDNMGSMLMYLLVLVAVVGIVILMKYFSKRFFWVNKFYNYMSKMLFFNVFLRIFLEGYI